MEQILAGRTPASTTACAPPRPGSDPLHTPILDPALRTRLSRLQSRRSRPVVRPGTAPLTSTPSLTNFNHWVRQARTRSDAVLWSESALAALS